MGGVFKKHRATYATEGVRLWYDNYNNRGNRNATGAYRQGIRCPMIKDVSGNEWHYIYATRGYANNYASQADLSGYNMASFNYLVAFATADELEDWHIDDWEIQAIGSTSQSKGCMFNDQVMQQVYTLNIRNPNENDEIIVKCIRFRRPIFVCSDSQYDNNTSSSSSGVVFTEVNALGYSYYLDEPITIPPQGNHSLTIKFSPMEM